MSKPHKFVSNGSDYGYDAIFCEYCGVLVQAGNLNDIQKKDNFKIAQSPCPNSPMVEDKL